MARLLIVLLFALTLPRAQAQRVGVVLSGGGAVGLTHIGVLQALEENGIPVDYVAGSSMGALIGALYATGWSPWQMDSLFRTPKFQMMAQGGVEAAYQYHFKESHPDAMMLGVRFNPDTTLQASLPTNLRSPVLMDYEQMVLFAAPSAAADYDLDRLFVPYRCVASDITARKQVVFSKGDLAQAVRASMSYPFYFKPIRIDGHLMMDGGLFNNFPSDVLYDAFMPDIIIGSNVSSNDLPPDEDDLMSQLKAMMTAPTNYDLPCSEGVIIEPKTSTTLFDFANAEQAVRDGYRSAMARMPEIKALLERRTPASNVALRRAQYKRSLPLLQFGDIQLEGLSAHQALFAERVLNKRAETLSAETLKPRYFRLYADQSVSGLFPRAVYKADSGLFDLTVNVRREKRLEVRFGGMYGSRPINSAMIGLRYNFFGRTSSRVDAVGYFGKFYTAGQIRWRTDLSSRRPIYLEPLITYNRWDFFRGFNSFFQEQRPSYIVDRERWAGVNVGMALGHKGLLRLDGKYADSRNSYYQDDDFVAKDTADITDFHFGTWGITMERNSLNRKQHPNSGELFRAEARLVNGLENNYPGTRSESRERLRTERAWFTAKVTLDKYFAPRGVIRYGLLAEGVYSTQPFLHNYKATLLRAPVFQPTPESRTYFLENFRATQYVAGGARMIIAVAKEKFDVRLEGYMFQPYRAIKREGFDQATEGTPISDRYFIASGSMIYQSPLGPLWFNASYIDGLRDPWVWSVNFGYVLFAQRSME